MTLFIDKIDFQQQPTFNTCVSTCLAMILNVDADKVISEFHPRYYNVVENKLKVTDYLTINGVPFEICDFEDSPKKDGVYLVTVPSLNIKGGTHNILWCIESSEREGYFFQRILDPATGREDRFYYTNIDDLLKSDPLATEVSCYGLDLHIPAEYFMQSLNSINKRV